MSEGARNDYSFGLACWSGPTRGMTIAHRHDDLEFNHAQVDLEYLIDGRPHAIPAGSVGVFWAARPHQLLGGHQPGLETWLTVPLHSALGWALPAGFLNRMLRGEVAAAAAAPAIDLPTMAARWRGELDSGGIERRIAETEIEAFTLRVAGAVGDDDSARLSSSSSSRTAGASPAAAATAMAAFLSEHFADDVAVRDVADHVHLNPQYAMTVFRRALGVTIGDYLTQRRVAAAQELLLTSTLPVSEVGFAAGFRSQSQFYERFSRWCGRSPGAYRRRLRPG